MDNNFSPAQIADEALKAWIDSDRFARIEQARTLTPRERVEQSIAAIKLIIFAPVLSGLTLDRILSRGLKPTVTIN